MSASIQVGGEAADVVFFDFAACDLFRRPQSMSIYEITRTRLVTERFRVNAETEEEAFDALGAEDSETVEKMEESTLQSDAEIQLLDKV